MLHDELVWKQMLFPTWIQSSKVEGFLAVCSNLEEWGPKMKPEKMENSKSKQILYTEVLFLK